MLCKRQCLIYFLLCTFFPFAASLIICRPTQILNVPCLARVSLKSIHKTFILDPISLLKSGNLKTNMLGSICTGRHTSLPASKSLPLLTPQYLRNSQDNFQFWLMQSYNSIIPRGWLEKGKTRKRQDSCRDVPISLLCKAIVWAHSSLWSVVSLLYGVLAHN